MAPGLSTGSLAARGLLSRRRSGFTLIELLVVIAIIALLISILLPTLKKAKDAARKAYCAGNLRHLGIGLAFYSDAYSGMLPPPRRPNIDGGTYWFEFINEFVEGRCYVDRPAYFAFPKTPVFICPQANKQDIPWQGTSYGYNIIAFGGSAQSNVFLRETEIAADTYFISDNVGIYMTSARSPNYPFSSIDPLHEVQGPFTGKGNMLRFGKYVETVAPDDSYRYNDLIKRNWMGPWSYKAGD